jgi:hypothetical protein
MSTAAKRTRENRTITVDFRDEATYLQLLDDGKAFVEFVFAFLLALGFQLLHKATCDGGGCLTRHSHYARVRLGGVTIWRIQCTTCKAVFTVLPHFILRYRQMRPEVARDALLATHGGLSLELCAVLYPEFEDHSTRIVEPHRKSKCYTMVIQCVYLGVLGSRSGLFDRKHTRWGLDAELFEVGRHLR